MRTQPLKLILISLAIISTLKAQTLYEQEYFNYLQKTCATCKETDLFRTIKSNINKNPFLNLIQLKKTIQQALINAQKSLGDIPHSIIVAMDDTKTRKLLQDNGYKPYTDNKKSFITQMRHGLIKNIYEKHTKIATPRNNMIRITTINTIKDPAFKNWCSTLFLAFKGGMVQKHEESDKWHISCFTKSGKLKNNLAFYCALDTNSKKKNDVAGGFVININDTVASIYWGAIDTQKKNKNIFSRMVERALYDIKSRV